MINRANTNGREVRHEMRGGQGDIILEALAAKASLPVGVRLFSKLIIAPGCSIGKHVHEGETELFYFASGKGRVWDDDAVLEVSAGDTMTTASGHSHSVENTGDEDLVLIAFIVLDPAQ